MSKLDTKFSDMPEGEKAAWRRWANSHDWGAEPAGFVGDKLVPFGQEHNPATGWQNVRAEHSTPRALRNWAGY
jgi:hypothetical protein